MKTLIHHILRSSLVIVALLFLSITSVFGQFPMGNTLAPLPGNKYPIVFSNDIKGGHYQVADIDARDAIYTERRLEGMLCTVLNDGSGSMKTYQLVGGTANTDWQEFSVNATTTDVIKVGSLAPTPAVSGDVYYNTTDNQFREYNGSAWVVVSSVPTGGALPGTAAEGDIFYNTTDHKLYFYNGTAWTELGGATIADNTISASKLQGSDGNALGTGTSGWLLQSDGTGKFSWLDTSGGLPVDPTSITLAQGSFLVGAASGKAAATAKTAIPISGFGAATADVAMGNQKITGLATPTAATDAATMGYVDGKTLDGLSNVNIGTKANNDLLFWDVASSKWINKTITDAGLDQSGTNEGALTVLAGTATTSLISSNTSGSTDVTIEVGGINSISETANKITITGTEVDGDPTNEVQYLTAGGTTSPTITLNEISAVGGGVITFEGAGGTTLSQNSGTITITSGSGTTDLSYDAATRTVASSTGDDAVLPTVDGTNAGLMSSTDKTKLDEITATGSGQIITDVERTKLSGLTNYTLPTASTTTLGGVKIDGTSVTIDGNGVISAQGSAAVQSELDATQTGAGLTTTGAYSANGSTNYLQAASSLKDADEKLDAQIKTVADAVATKGNGTVTEVQGTADRISVTDGTTVPVVDIASTYAGQSSITTLGTVTTGTWNGSVIAPAYGGTGVDNGTNTITLGGNLTTTVGNVQLNSAPGGSTVTLPSTGTLVSTTDLAAGVSPIGSTLNSGKIIVGSSENKAAAVDMGGDATIDDAGALTIENARVTAAKLTAGAGAADRVAVADAAGVVTYGSLPAGALPSSIDATKIGNGTVSSTEFQTLSDINTGQTVQTQLNSKASQSELDATQTGAGLDTDGSYSANASTNYLKTANSLKDADEKLDTQLKAIADGYVPYTGATGNVDLGTNNIIANSIRLTSGAQNGYILKSDASGNASWQAATSAYKGTWNADTNTPAIADGTGSTGDYYLVSVSGTQFGRSFVQGGQAVYNGTIWESIATSQAVSSVNGLTGAVQINPGLSGNTLSLTGGTLTVDLSTATAVAAATTKGNDLQSELDATQAGAGLATNGAYAANGSTNYIQTATSLKDADEKLDTQIKTVTDAVNSLSSGSLSGDVSGTLSTTSVDKIKGVSLGTTTATSGNVLVGSGTTWETRTVSGDVTISGTGVTAIGMGVIVDADVNAAAAIAGTKISPNFGSQNVVTTGNINGAILTTSGDATISGADLTLGVAATAKAGTIVMNDGGTGTYNVTLSAPATVASSNKTITLPDASGTVALTSDITGSSLSGDVSGTLSSTSVDKIKGVSVPALSTGLLKYNGSAWAFDNSSYLTSVGTFNLGTTSISLNRASGSQTLTGISIDGNAATSTTATNTGITATTTNATYYPTFVSATTGNLPQNVSYAGLSFNPSTGTLTATNFTGNGSGLTNVSASSFSGTLSGDISGTQSATAITAGAIVDADVNAAAAIAGTKISPNFGSQNVVTTGNINGAILTTSGDATISGADLTLGVAATAKAGTIVMNDGGTGTYNVTLSAPATVASSNKTITLPDASGTVALTSDITGSSLSGDVSGTLSSTSVDKIKGVSVPALSTGLLKYNGSAWAFDNSSYLTSVGTFNLGTTSISLNRASGSQTLTGISIDGNAATSTTATNTGITATTTNATYYPTFVSATTGNLPQNVSSAGLSFNPSTGTLTATNFTGNGSGLTNVSASSFSGTLSGDISGTQSATAITAGAIVDADVNAAAAIAGTKISPNFGSQNVVTTGNINGAILTTSGDATISGADLTLGVAATAKAGTIVMNDGGTGTYNVTLSAPATVASSNKTITLPDASGTVALTSDITGSSLSGDVSGTLSSTSVDKIKGVSVPALSTGLLKYNGSAWAFDNSSYLTSVGTFNLGTTSISLNRASGSQTLTGISIDGNAATSTTATNTGITATTTNATYYPTFVSATTGNLPQNVSSAGLSFNPSTGTLTATNFTGNGSGLTNVSASSFSGTLSGDISGTQSATAITAGAIVDADVNAAAAIAGTKISPNFGSQNVVTTGNINGAILTTSGDATISGADLTLGVAATAKAGTIVMNDGGTGTYNVTLSAPATVASSNKTITLPDASGTVALTSDITTDVFDAAITGNIDGSNQAFTLPSTFVAGTTRVYLNGLRLKRGVTAGVGYYQETGNNQITFGVAPQIGDVIIVDYKH